MIPPYRPQLATLADEAPQGDRWLHELKYDGYRIGCTINHGIVRLESRNAKDWTRSFPEVVASVHQLSVKQALLDGEAVVLLPDGRSSFQNLQNAFHGSSRDGLSYIVFDLLYLDGVDMRSMPLERRKSELERLIRRGTQQNVLRYADHIIGNGPAVFERASALGAEGIISKRRDQPYCAGRNDWLKVTCLRSGNFVLAGFIRATGSRVAASSLLLGYYDEGGCFRFAGNVGTGRGFTNKFLTELGRRLASIEQRTCPFGGKPKIGWRNVHWIEPRVVVEVGYLEWTEDGHLRHPTFQGFRPDKRPQECITPKQSLPEPP